jgi:hypothetical protein
MAAWLPDLHRLTNGAYEATCGRCLTYGKTTATAPEAAWTELQGAGWRRPEGRIYAVCPKCAVDPGGIEAAVARARRHRKRK